MKKNWYYILIMAALVVLAWTSNGYAQAKRVKDQGKTITCDESKAKTIKVTFGRLTVVNFPIAPKEIIPGDSSFDFFKIKSDVAIKALRSNARTNIFVYMQERRCSFNLVTVSSGGDEMLYVRDPKDKQIEVNF
jgi:hypothetical protein